MGTFLGHVAPGSFFVAFGLWWTFQIFHRYFRSLTKTGPAFQCTATYQTQCCCWRRSCEVEGFFKIFFAFLGVFAEVLTGFNDGNFAYLGNGQHATMYVFLGLSGAVDLIVHFKIPLPKGVEYLSMILFFVVESILFKFHLHGRSGLNVLIHTLLLYTAYGSAVSCIIEARYRRSILAALTRAFCVLAQGTWFWFVAFILYNPWTGDTSWGQENHDHMVFATMLFAWNLGGVFVLMLILGGFVALTLHCRGELSKDGRYDDQMQLIKRDANGHTIVNLNNDDTESEVEFERSYE